MGVFRARLDLAKTCKSGALGAVVFALALGVSPASVSAQDAGVSADAASHADLAAPPPDAGSASEEPAAVVPVEAPPLAGAERPAHQSAVARRTSPTRRARRPVIRLADEIGVGAGLRAGITVNSDQWALGGYARYDGFCLGGCANNLSIEVLLLVGLGGNHMTIRESVRLQYLFWLYKKAFGLYPIVGNSILGYVPVGPFASFCNRVELSGCGGWDVGFEIGGGIRIWNFSFETVVGVGGIPVVTILLGLHFPIWRSVR